MNYTTLPNEIPMHFNLKGEADDYGGKNILIALPIISFITSVILIYMTKFPHNYNYPVKITKENALKEYTYSKQMMLHLAVVVSAIFLFVTHMIISKAQGTPNLFGEWNTVLIVIVAIIPIILYMIRRKN